MAGLWPRTGNVTVTNGSKIVTGFGTKWKTGTLPIQKGHTFYGPDNFAYEVDTVVSDESLTLVEAYRGGTLANQGYRIDITRTSTISQFAADLASLVAKYRAWFDGMMTWLTGSGDVAILNPDTGANVTIPSWKKVASEGEGQTARAKVEADRAKTEADRAFTEADRAAGIVAAAALPLPDVWAPLSDSLRLLTGFGRDVLVGSDVVARMASFARSTTATYIGKDGSLKAAAANEPRFEKEGLLLEGQSTNLIPISNFPQNLAGWIAPNSSGNTHSYGSAPDGSNTAMKVSFSGDGLNRGVPELVDGVAYTFSFYAKNENPAAVEFLIRIGGSTGSVVFQVPGNTPWRRYQVTQTYKEGDRSVRWYVNTKNVEIWLWGAQLEALPFASSYIPTSGAATTRTADIVTIPWALNVPTSNLTVAINYDLFSISLAQQRIMEYSAPVIPRYLFQVVSDNGGEFHTMAGTNALKVAAPNIAPGAVAAASTTPTRHALKITGKNISAYAATGPTGATSNINIGSAANGGSPMYGHVRNLRIWHRALTDDQLKAVA
ncbi:LamG-like jellyroll fold domain-containing protein [Aeromonas caviae]|uniref:phage head spike fiber domain-containing protein n=1 Tax=Aeromonas caviae TaxID=648 RepID=UPI0038D18235